MRKNKSTLAVVLILVTLITLLTVGCDIDEPVLVDTNATQSATNSSNQNTKKTFAVGETAQLNDVQVCLVGVTESTGSSFNKPTEENVFVLCEFNITNNSNEDLAVSSMMSFEAYCDDYTCSFSFGALLEKGNKNQLDGTVAAGKKLNGVIGYEVPENWKELEISFTPDVWSSKDITFVAKNN